MARESPTEKVTHFFGLGNGFSEGTGRSENGLRFGTYASEMHVHMPLDC